MSAAGAFHRGTGVPAPVHPTLARWPQKRASPILSDVCIRRVYCPGVRDLTRLERGRCCTARQTSATPRAREGAVNTHLLLFSAAVIWTVKQSSDVQNNSMKSPLAEDNPVAVVVSTENYTRERSVESR